MTPQKNRDVKGNSHQISQDWGYFFQSHKNTFECVEKQIGGHKKNPVFANFQQVIAINVKVETQQCNVRQIISRLSRKFGL